MATGAQTLLGAASVAAGAAQTFQPIMHYEADGRVGIGTNAPGNHTLTAAGETFIDVTGAGDNNNRSVGLGVRYEANGNYVPDTDPTDGKRGFTLFTETADLPVVMTMRNIANGFWDFIYDPSDANKLHFRHNSTATPALTMQGNGLVGVGVNTPEEKLDVDGTARLRGLQAENLPTNNVVVADANGVLKTMTQAELATAANDNPWDNPDASVANQSSTDISYLEGSVGIGIAAPNQQLEVYNTNRATFQVTSATGNAEIRALSQANNDANLRLGNEGETNPWWTIAADRDDANKLKIGNAFTVGSRNRLTIEDGGNVGVGTDAPTEKLDVDGNSSSANIFLTPMPVILELTLNMMLL